jgi:hypothetical protein
MARLEETLIIQPHLIHPFQPDTNTYRRESDVPYLFLRPYISNDDPNISQSSCEF